MARHKIVKLTAKTTLKDKWTGAVIVSSVFLGVCLFNTLIGELLYSIGNVFFFTIFSLLFLVFLIIPLILGLLDYFRALAFGEEANFNRLFIGFTSADEYTRYLSFSLSMFIRVVLAYAFLSLPSSITKAMSEPSTYTTLNLPIPVWTTALSVISSMLYIFGLCLLVVFMLRYFMAPFLLVSNKDMSAKEAIMLSKIISKGHKFEFVKLAFSMIFYIILSLFFLPLLFTLPYFMMCYVTLCRFTVYEYNKSIKESFYI